MSCSGIISVERCPRCGGEYTCERREQTPGFRMLEEEVCPYCGYVVRTSLEWEFTIWEDEGVKLP